MGTITVMAHRVVIRIKLINTCKKLRIVTSKDWKLNESSLLYLEYKRERKGYNEKEKSLHLFLATLFRDRHLGKGLNRTLIIFLS